MRLAEYTAAVLLVGVGAALLVPAGRPDLPSHHPRSAESARASPMARLARHPRAVSWAAAVAVAWVVGGFMGFALATLLGLAVPPLVAALRDREASQRREAAAAQAGLVADLLAACLVAGSTVPDAISAVAAAVERPARHALQEASRIARLGGDTSAVVAPLRTAGISVVADAVDRAAVSGAPLEAVLTGEAQRLQALWSASATIRARAVAVRSVLPLALCYLPAFLLLGVVPVVASFAGGLLPGS